MMMEGVGREGGRYREDEGVGWGFGRGGKGLVLYRDCLMVTGDTTQKRREKKRRKPSSRHARQSIIYYITNESSRGQLVNEGYITNESSRRILVKESTAMSGGVAREAVASRSGGDRPFPRMAVGVPRPP